MTLRSEVSNKMDTAQLRGMIVGHGFFDSRVNLLGRGVPHAYALRVLPRPWIDARLRDIPDDSGLRIRSVQVVEVRSGSPAARSGLQPLDLIVAVGGTPVSALPDCRHEVARRQIGVTVSLDVLRSNFRISLQAQVEEALDTVLVDYSTGLMWLLPVDRWLMGSRTVAPNIYAGGERIRAGYKELDLHHVWDGCSGCGPDDYVAAANLVSRAGFSGWRLPTLEEAMALVEPLPASDRYVNPIFGNVLGTWTSDYESHKHYSITNWKVSFACGCADRSSDAMNILARAGAYQLSTAGFGVSQYLVRVHTNQAKAGPSLCG